MKKFIHLLRVRYAECDAQKVVFNGKYAEYVDVAATEYSRAVWGDYDDILAMGVDSQVVKLTINWQAPARFDDVIAISVSTSHIGNTSYAFAFEFHNHDSGTLVAIAETVYVMVSPTEHTKIAIPEDLKISLANGAPGVVVNQAGV